MYSCSLQTLEVIKHLQKKTRKFRKLLFKSKAIEKRLGNTIKPNKLVQKHENNLRKTKTAK